MGGLLQDVRILEFTEILAGPWGGRILGDLGADIIKVEPVAGEPWRLWGQAADLDSPGFMTLNWGKRAVAVNLRTPEGQEIIRRLVPLMDVVIINYRPDTPKNLSIDYETLSSINPRLVYVEATALGRLGPSSHRPGYDIIAQAMSGLMIANSKVGADGNLSPITPAVADMGTSLSIAWAVCAGLYARERTGSGMKIETSLLATALGLQGSGLIELERASGRGGAGALADRIREAKRAGASWDQLVEMRQGRSASNAYYRTYHTKDSMIVVGALSTALHRAAAKAIGVEDQRLTDPEFPKSGPENERVALEVTAKAVQIVAGKTTSEWLEIFDAAGVPAAPIVDPLDVLDDPQVRANGLTAELDHPAAGRVKLLSSTLVVDGERPLPGRPSPGLGEHTADVLSELGYSPEDVASLRGRGVVA